MENTLDKGIWVRGLIATALTCTVIALIYVFAGSLWQLPAQAIMPLSAWVGDGLSWFAREAAIGDLRVADMTRAIAAMAQMPIDGLQFLLADGFVRGAGFNKVQLAPPLSWLGVILVASLVSLRLGSRGLVLLTLTAGFYLVFFGLWGAAMTTFASVLLCVIVALLVGLGLGIWAYRSPATEKILRMVMNVMQTVPLFSYLLPTLLLFGYGPSAALFATVIYALPPMLHATVLALRSIPDETRELARMSGCSRLQTLTKVELPVAVPRLAIGLNQVVMMTLNMVIIASMIGAGGLGYNVLRALRRLDFGTGFEAGMGIVALAVVLDRLTQAAARNRSTGRINLWRWRDSLLALFLLAVPTFASLLFPPLAIWPSSWALTTAVFWNGAVSFINQNFYEPLDTVRTFMLLGVMNPLRDLLVATPWSLVLTLMAFIGYRLGGGRIVILLMALLLFIALTGYWEAAMTSLYLIILSVLLALAVGLPLGIWIAAYPRLHKTVQLVLDTLQTLPSLVYLLPVVMLFRNGDFSALIAIFLYAVAPAIRYAMAAMGHVPLDRIEAATMAGCSKWQTFRFVRLPASLPTLLLGVNQTIMMALSMLVIAALVGTRELGQQVYTALARGETGPGIVAGLCVAAIALIADTLLKAAASRAARHEGKIHV